MRGEKAWWKREKGCEGTRRRGRGCEEGECTRGERRDVRGRRRGGGVARESGECSRGEKRDARRRGEV